MDKINLKKVLSIYRDKKVFITGHNGFKGSWLSYLLNYLGADVYGYSLKNHSVLNHFDALKLESKIHHEIGDVRDYSKLSNAISNFQPDFIFHLAAQALVIDSYKDPMNTFTTNCIGSLNILDIAKNSSFLKSFILVTSDKCYENLEWEYGYRENDRLGGHDPYSASKAGAEIIFSAYNRSFFHKNETCGVGSARAGNVIGGGDWSKNRIIPDCIKAIENNKPIVIRNPNATRPWQHVLEPLTGYLYLGYALYRYPNMYSGSWNFGPKPSQIKNVREVASKIIDNFGRGKLEIKKLEGQDHESNLLQLNCDKSNQKLNWNPVWNIDKTLKYTAEWYKLFYHGEDPSEITSDQIKKYFKGAI